MTSLRDGLCAPRRHPSPEEVSRLRAYLDGQSRVRLAAWASHEHQTPDGTDYDEHLLLGIPDADFEGEHGRALEIGIGSELGGVGGWLDLFALSDATTVREIGDVLWARDGAPGGDLDPLDFRSTWEPLDVPATAVAAFADLVRGVRGVRRIEAVQERLWKNGREVRSEGRLHVDFDARRPDDFDRITSAVRDAGLGTTAISAGLPSDDRVRTAVLYER